MKKSISLSMLLIAIGVIFSIPVQANSATVTVTNLPADGILELAVGESYVFDIQVASDETFISAVAMPDQFYPGRGVFYSGPARARQDTSASLQLDITGKDSTADLPGGVAPISIVVAVRYAGGVVVVEQFDLNVRVQ